jgi:DNA adenine methylase
MATDEERKPLIKWAGGKRRLLAEIRQVLPGNFNRYYEPFLGSGALFFSLLPAAAHLSDANQELIEMYVEVRDNVESLIGKLRRLRNSEWDYYRVRGSAPRSKTGKAARLIYLCTLSFNGIYRQNLKGEFNVPYGYKTHLKHYDIDRLREASRQLQGQAIRYEDFEHAVQYAKAGDLVYFDPPYTVAHGNNGFVKYNAKIFSWDDQKRLAQTALRLKALGCRVVVSNADHQSIRELYPEFNVHVVERFSVMSASSEFRRPVRECLFY